MGEKGFSHRSLDNTSNKASSSADNNNRNNKYNNMGSPPTHNNNKRNNDRYDMKNGNGRRGDRTFLSVCV